VGGLPFIAEDLGIITPDVGAFALDERSVFTPGAIWDINSFDQWGVEPGKAVARRVTEEVDGRAEPARAHESSTNRLIGRYPARKDATR
jgi:glucose-6-phosphate isomerase